MHYFTFFNVKVASIKSLLLTYFILLILVNTVLNTGTVKIFWQNCLLLQYIQFNTMMKEKVLNTSRGSRHEGMYAEGCSMLAAETPKPHAEASDPLWKWSQMRTSAFDDFQSICIFESLYLTGTFLWMFYVSMKVYILKSHKSRAYCIWNGALGVVYKLSYCCTEGKNHSGKQM